MKKINVTSNHIKRGKPENCESCPIALAVREQLHWSKAETYVSDNIGSVDRHVHYRLPEKAKRFMDRFDNALSVKPFTFNLRRL